MARKVSHEAKKLNFVEQAQDLPIKSKQSFTCWLATTAAKVVDLKVEREALHARHRPLSCQ